MPASDYISKPRWLPIKIKLRRGVQYYPQFTAESGLFQYCRKNNFIPKRLRERERDFFVAAILDIGSSLGGGSTSNLSFFFFLIALCCLS